MRNVLAVVVAVGVWLAPCARAQAAPEAKRIPVPRWTMAPIAKPYFVSWFGAPSPRTAGFSSQAILTTQTIETLSQGDDAYWIGRGVWPSNWYYGSQGEEWLGSVQAYVDYFEKEAIGKGATCIVFDEWVGTDTVQDIQAFFDSTDLPPAVREHAEQFWKNVAGNKFNVILAKACQVLKQKYPDVFIMAYTHMQSQSLYEALRRGWVDLAIVEAYEFVPNEPDWTPALAHWRIGLAAKAGLLEKTIPAISVYEAVDKATGKRTTAEMLEQEIRYYRENYPQMPGIGFYCTQHNVRTDAAAQRALIRTCDRLVRQYYVDPAPKPRITSPEDGALVTTPLRIVAAADGAVATWKLFVGATLVAEQRSPEFVVTELAPGPNVITVHAVTKDYLRGAAQIEVESPAASKE
jgi:hypothetical protein